MNSKWTRRIAWSAVTLVAWIATPARSRAAATPSFSAGFATTCAVKSDGTLWCWGRNFDGELGTASTTPVVPDHEVNPVFVARVGNDVADVTAGDTKTCARKLDGALWCWGTAYDSQNKAIDVQTPAPLGGLGPTASGVAAGHDHYCAITTQNTLWCWGSNTYGQIGDGTVALRPSPVQVTALGAEVVEVAASNDHSCARKADGTLWCWGYNLDGEAGNGTTTVRKTSPVQVAALGNQVAEVSLGFYHTCARTNDGAVYCWGADDSGQLGTDTPPDPPAPTQVLGLGNNVAKLSHGNGGEGHSCAIETDGTLWCWGRNSEGQLGNDDPLKANTSNPVQVTALGSSVVEVSTGGFHTCATKTDGSLWCWGTGSSGEIGDGSINVARLSPVQVTGFGPVVPPASAPAGGRDALATLAAILLVAGWAIAGRGSMATA